MTFSNVDRLTALAIVRVFETGRALGDYGAVAVLDDGAGISYGIDQFTHRSGSLAAVVRKYLASGGSVERDALASALPALDDKRPASVAALARDIGFRSALRAAAEMQEMHVAQDETAARLYLGPAITICTQKNFCEPLSLAVIFDSITHGNWERIASGVHTSTANERAWITEYLNRRDRWLASIPRLRPTRYRTQFFLAQIAGGNWTLRLPLLIHGVRLAAAPVRTPPAPASESAKPAGILRSAGETVQKAADGFDRVNAIATAVTERTDAAKSLWTTLGGTLWQALWALFGFLTGLPREIWIVVAVIAALLMLLYLYRQIELGRIREKAAAGLPQNLKA